MNPPAPLSTWIEDKCGRFEHATVRRPRTISETWTRHTGGRVLKAGVSASIEASSTFSLEDDAAGVPEEFVAAARDGAITVLLTYSWIPVLNVRVRLFNFEVDQEGSCYAAFYCVAKEALRALLGLKEDVHFNIAGPGESANEA